MLVQEFMTEKALSVSPDDTVGLAKQLLDKHRFHHLLVVENKQLVGVVSAGDILKGTSPYVGTQAETSRDTALLTRKMHQIMGRKLITTQPNDSLIKAIELMVTSGVSCLPVVEQDNTIVGIVSWRDILAAVHGELLNQS
jgi:acetoin utilization protein AcuB